MSLWGLSEICAGMSEVSHGIVHKLTDFNSKTTQKKENWLKSNLQANNLNIWYVYMCIELKSANKCQILVVVVL